MNFKTNLKSIRKNRGYTQETFSKLINVPYKTYVNWEQGANEPNFKQLEEIKNKLNCTYDDLLK